MLVAARSAASRVWDKMTPNSAKPNLRMLLIIFIVLGSFGAWIIGVSGPGYSKKFPKYFDSNESTPAIFVYINSMKKLLLLSAILLGAATASQAGVRFNFGFGLPLPVPAFVAPAPVYQAP